MSHNADAPPEIPDPKAAPPASPRPPAAERTAPNPGDWVHPLDAAGLTLADAGGKGANLSRLARAGFPVPPAFVVTTGAYRAYVAVNDLQGVIRRQLADLAPDDPAALEAASCAIRDAFAAGTLPAHLADAVLAAYDDLGRPAVAVRSSATAEDLPAASFAGQQDTFLNVVGADALLDAVVRCWSSLWTARAIGYRARQATGCQAGQGIGQGDLALAIVVQAMVPAEASGVLFTADPLTGKRTVMVVEATLGLGEALVAGQVEPDRYVVDAASGQVLARTLGAKALSIHGRPGGGTVRRAEDAAERPALPGAAVAALAELGRRAAMLFGAPQDVEWAWAGGRLHLLQSRPVTSLYPLPAGMPPDPLRVMFSFAAVQGIIGPMTPLGRDAIAAVFAGAAGLFGYRLDRDSQRVLHTAGGRLWIDLTGLIRNGAGRRVLRAAMPMLEPGIAAALDTLWDDPRLPAGGGPAPRTLWRLARAVLPVLPRLLRSALWPDAERRRFLRQLEARLAAFEADLAATTTPAARLAWLEEVLAGAFRFLVPQFVPCFAPAMASLTLLNRLAAGLPAGSELALTVTRGMPHNVTTEMDLALWAAAQRIAADPASAARLPAVAQQAVGEFLARYGARAVGEIDLGRPRWREEPAHIFQVLVSYLQIDDPARAPDAVFARGAAAAEAAVEQLARALRATAGGTRKAALARWAARRVRALAGIRESPKFWAVRVMGLVRDALLEAGAELVAEGVLTRPGDVFFLHLNELQALARGKGEDWPARVRARRAAYAREMGRQQVPRLLLSDGQAFYEGVAAPPAGEEGVLAGSGVSPGVAEGPVRVVLDPRGVALAPGEILVCPGTDPAWTPLFLVAGGLVMEVGGLMTHGSVVAREYGIPAVVGVHQATARLRTGQRVRVDGTAGRVECL